MIRIPLVLTVVGLSLTGTVPAATGPDTRVAPQRPAVVQPKPATAPRKREVAPRLNINTAAKEDLLRLPGVTEREATAIIRGRPYRTKVELKTKKILSVPLYNAVAPRLMTTQARKGS